VGSEVKGECVLLDKTNGKMNNVNIRSLNLSDAEDLQRHCFPGESPESVTDYVRRALRFVERGQAAHLVAEADGHAIASADRGSQRRRCRTGR
jgi:hypothetical protein